MSDTNTCFQACHMFFLSKLSPRKILCFTIVFTSAFLIVRFISNLEEAFIEAPFCKGCQFVLISQPPRFGIPPIRSIPGRVGATPGNATGLVVLYNYLSPSIFDDGKILTLATHATTEFLFDELIDLVSSWPTNPLSVAITPSGDVCTTVAILSWLWNCVNGVKLRVTFHLILEDNQAALFLRARPLMEVDCSTSLSKKKIKNLIARRSPYLVNIARNVARTSALTHFVLMSDIELLPSPNLALNFENFANRKSLFSSEKVVYVVPTFEIEASEENRLPKSHQELARLYKTEKVVFFHALVCKKCQNFPKIKAWIDLKVKPGDDGLDSSVEIFTVAKREVPFHRWEPIYIGTNAEPLYDERLSWEGYQDKMTQMHELCLEGYNFAILDTAFLLHRPGIKKHKDKSQEDLRLQFIKQNSLFYAEIMNEMRKRFHTNETRCKEYN